MNENDSKLTLESLQDKLKNPIKIKSMIEFQNLFKNKNIALFPCKEEFKRDSLNKRDFKQNEE